jgi:DNA-binding winged helix-turn-helix (wHTH) protein/TolB-like protein/tetratricopeptide (TPR) repeat protein
MSEHPAAVDAAVTGNGGLVRFGTFELDPCSGQLRRNGRRVPLQDQPARALCLLASRPGQLVTREELRQALWPADTFVEFDTALNIVVTKVRHALGDAAVSSRFIETVPKRGYRFIADVHQADQATSATTNGDDPVTTGPPTAPTPTRSARQSMTWRIVGGVVVSALVLFAATRFARLPAASVAPPRSIAVLPFKPVIASEGDQRLELGMTEALIKQLSRIATLRVEPLPRVRRYRASDQDPLEAGRDLGVDAVLEGHVQRSNDRVYVRVRLVRTADGTALATNEWRESFSDIFAIQRGVGQSVMSALDLTLRPEDHAGIGRPETTNAEAYRHYLFGRHQLEIRTREHVKEAEREFREAIRLDSRYAAAHAGLALTLAQLPWQDGADPLDVVGPSKEAAMRALGIDEGVALAHAVLARIHEWYDLDPIRAQREHLRAMALGPQEPWVLRGYAHFLANRDAFDEALELSSRDLALDPTSLLANRYRAQMFFFARRYDDCVAQSHTTLALDPRDLTLSYSWLARCLERLGNEPDAIDLWERARALKGQTELAESMKRVYRERGAAGYWRERMKVVDHGIEMALLHVRLGDSDAALAHLERLIDRRHPSFTWLNHPGFDPVRSHPRFQTLRRRAGLSDEMNASLKTWRPPLLGDGASGSTP